MRLTQQQLVLDYLREHGSIIPAKMSGLIYQGIMFGSETSKRCRELRAEGLLSSELSGKFERFYLTNPVPEEKKSMNLDDMIQKRDELRKQWKQADPSSKRILEVRGKALTRAIELKQLEANVKTTLF